MIHFIGPFITYMVEVISVAYRALLLWLIYPWLTDIIQGIPESISYFGMFLIIFMIRIIFLDFTDVFDVSMLEREDDE